MLLEAIDIATAIHTALADEFGDTFDVEKSTRPSRSSEDLAATSRAVIWVVPRGADQTRLTRASLMGDAVIEIGVQRHARMGSGDEYADIRAAMEALGDVTDFLFSPTRTPMAGAELADQESSASMDVLHADQFRVATAAVRLTYQLQKELT